MSSHHQEADAESAQSTEIDSIDERLELASLNAHHNKNPGRSSVTDFTPSAEYLTTSNDEDLKAQAKRKAKGKGRASPEPVADPQSASSSRQTPNILRPVEASASSASQPPSTPKLWHSLTQQEMDRRLRQSKPRLLLMGQRR
jgi:hypothetical protein